MSIGIVGRLGDEENKQTSKGKTRIRNKIILEEGKISNL